MLMVKTMKMVGAGGTRASFSGGFGIIRTRLTTSFSSASFLHEPVGAIAPPKRFARIRSMFSKKKEVDLGPVVPKKPYFQRKWRQWSGQLAIETEIADLFLLEKFASLTESLNISDLPELHPCQEIASESRILIKDLWRLDIIDKSTKIKHVFKELEKYHNREQERRKKDVENFVSLVKDNSGDIKNQWRWDCEATLRLSICQLYSQRLVVAIEEGTIPVDALHSEEKMLSIVNTILLGSTAERVAEHLRLYSPSLDQASLQDAFYVLYDPEVATVSSALMIVRGLHNDLAKQIPKFTDSYLLDRLELNVKSRSVFCWSDEKFTGIKPLADDHVIPIEDIIKSRAEYFEEGGEVAKQFVEHLTGDRRMHYHDSKDFRETAQKGFAFWMGCIVLDSYFTHM